MASGHLYKQTDTDLHWVRLRSERMDIIILTYWVLFRRGLVGFELGWAWLGKGLIGWVGISQLLAYVSTTYEGQVNK